MRLNKGLVFTNDNCIGCNRCISVCPVIGANVAERKNNRNVIMVDGDKCIHCGKCMQACDHGAREYRDDTEKLFNDLANIDSNISVLISRSFILQYPQEYKKVFGLLKEKGVKHIFNIDFGGRITSWAYLEYSKNNDVRGTISGHCPVVTNYVMKYKPELASKFLPIHGTIVSAAIYLKKYKNVSEHFAYIGPCIARKDEFDSDASGGIISYNVTYDHLMKEVNKYELSRFEDADLEEVMPGSILYQEAGGVGDLFSRILDEDKFIRTVTGSENIFDYLENYKNNIIDRKVLPDFVDISNCKNGCEYGAGTKFVRQDGDETLLRAMQREKRALRNNKYTIYCDSNTPQKNRNDIEKIFKKLDLKDFLKTTSVSDFVYEKLVSNEEIERIFTEMGKDTPVSRHINCGSCGYKSCKEMVNAIARGYNYKNNCIYYVKSALLNEKKELSNMIEKMNDAKEEIARVSKAKTDFLAKMSHEIRTPINVITGLTELLICDEKDEELKNYAYDIKNASGSLLSLINDILDLSKLEAGKIEINNAAYDTEYLFKDIINIMRIPIEQKGLEFKVDISNGISKTLYGDEARIRQILINILNNACKFTKEGYIELKAYSTRKDGFELMTFEVSDTGVGIKEGDFGKLFSEFEQIRNDKNKDTKGTGLGLPISKELANLMDGDIKVESEYGRGSKFIITIMQKIILDENDSKLSETEKVMNMDGENFGFTVNNVEALVVDDNEVNLKVCCKILNKYGINAKTAMNGIEAIDLIKRNKFDIVFMDQMMPEMDGVEATKNIRLLDDKYFKELPIVALTANALTGNREILLEQGFSDFISKPIDIKYLEKVLKRWLSSKIIADEAKEKYNELIISKRQEFEDKYSRDQDEIIIDAMMGITKCAGSEEIYLDVLETFYEVAEKHMATMNTMFETKDFEGYKIEVHALKNSAANIGANKLSELAKTLEFAVKEGNISAVENSHGELIKQYEEVVELLKPYSIGTKSIYDPKGKMLIDKEDIISTIRSVEKNMAKSNIFAAVQDIYKVLKYAYVDPRVMEKLNDAKNVLAIDFNIRKGKEKIEEIRSLLDSDDTLIIQ